MKAMILAAGRGTRMAPLTDNCPKPLLLLAGQPLIVHHIKKLVKAGIHEIVINHAWLGSMIEDKLGDGLHLGASIHYSPEEQALETAGGILQALPLLGQESFLLVNGDVWIDGGYERFLVPELLPSGLNEQRLAHVWLVPNPDHNPDGDFVLTDGLVHDDGAGFGHVAGEVADKLTFSGISLIHPDLVADLEPGKRPLAPVLRQAMACGQVSGSALPADCGWVDVGTPERLRQLRDRLT